MGYRCSVFSFANEWLNSNIRSWDIYYYLKFFFLLINCTNHPQNFSICENLLKFTQVSLSWACRLTDSFHSSLPSSFDLSHHPSPIQRIPTYPTTYTLSMHTNPEDFYADLCPSWNYVNPSEFRPNTHECRRFYLETLTVLILLPNRAQEISHHNFR